MWKLKNVFMKKQHLQVFHQPSPQYEKNLECCRHIILTKLHVTKMTLCWNKKKKGCYSSTRCSISRCKSNRTWASMLNLIEYRILYLKPFSLFWISLLYSSFLKNKILWNYNRNKVVLHVMLDAIVQNLRDIW